MGEPAERPVQPGHRLHGDAHRPPPVRRDEHPAADRAAPVGSPGPDAAAGRRPAGDGPGPGQVPGGAVPRLRRFRPGPEDGVHRDGRRAGPGRYQPKTDPIVRIKAPAVVPIARVETPPANRPTRSAAVATSYQTRPTGSERGKEPILFPALVIGLGGTGLAAPRHLRRLVHDRFDRPTLPNLQFLFIDTDPKAAEDAVGRPATGRPVRRGSPVRPAPVAGGLPGPAGTGGHRHAAHPRNVGRAATHPRHARGPWTRPAGPGRTLRGRPRPPPGGPGRVH